eukprot:8499561-Pyramimonas_sp.AAC.1
MSAGRSRPEQLWHKARSKTDIEQAGPENFESCLRNWWPAVALSSSTRNLLPIPPPSSYAPHSYIYFRSPT